MGMDISDDHNADDDDDGGDDDDNDDGMMIKSGKVLGPGPSSKLYTIVFFSHYCKTWAEYMSRHMMAVKSMMIHDQQKNLQNSAILNFLELDSKKH